MGWRRRAVTAGRVLGFPRIASVWLGRGRLTVLAYHRIVDHTADDFLGFIANVSARPESFEEQMEWVARRSNPVSITDVAASIGGAPLPERALLVTFDDGYRDNREVALPILRRRSIPMVVFLATDFIGTSAPFWWDRAAWMFKEAGPGRGELPVLGSRQWEDPHRIAVEWVRAAKRLADEAKDEAIAQLEASLGVGGPGDAFTGCIMGWDEVRSMSEMGVHFGAHTCRHPILSRVDPRRARREVLESIARVESETGRASLGFAYPNGQVDDAPEAAVEAVREAGVPLGFTLVPGPARSGEVRRDPLRIRRVYLHHTDDMAMFEAKVAGLNRIWR